MSLHKRKVLRGVLSGVALFVVWFGASSIYPELVPNPIEVMFLIEEIVVEGGPRGESALVHLGETLYRVFVPVLAIIVLSVLLGSLMGTIPWVESFVEPFMPFWVSVPDVVIIIIAMILLGFGNQAVILSTIILVTPFGVMSIWEGIQDLDHDLVEMGEAFDISLYLKWRYLYIPHLLPYIFGTTRYVLGMTWKIVVLAEALGLESGIGAMFRIWYNHRNIAILLAYFLLFVGVMLLIEYGLLRPLERRSLRWQDTEQS